MGFDVHVILIIKVVLNLFKIRFHFRIIGEVNWRYQKTSPYIMFFQVDRKSGGVLIIPAIEQHLVAVAIFGRAEVFSDVFEKPGSVHTPFTAVKILICLKFRVGIGDSRHTRHHVVAVQKVRLGAIITVLVGTQTFWKFHLNFLIWVLIFHYLKTLFIVVLPSKIGIKRFH